MQEPFLLPMKKSKPPDFSEGYDPAPASSLPLLADAKGPLDRHNDLRFEIPGGNCLLDHALLIGLRQQVQAAAFIDLSGCLVLS